MRERGLLFAELVHGVGEAIPKHTHHAAFYHLTLAGGYEESTARGMRSFPPFSSAFIAGDTRHFARVGNAGVHLFTMEMDSRWIQELREAGGEVENTDDSIGGVLTCVGLRLYREYKAGDGANALTVDSLAWEFLAAAARMRREKCTKPPAWWRRIVDLLHSESARDLRVADLAREASVHPVHLARVFRRLTNQTPGEWLQRIRVYAAFRELSAGTEDIAAVATELGFADQSHLTRMLKRHTSYTPALFRDTFGRSFGEPPLVKALSWSLARAKRPI